MSINRYITASCVINKGGLYKNGQRLFENTSVEAPDFLLAAYNFLDIKYPKFYKMDNLAKLGWLAAEVLLKDSFDKSKYAPEQTGIVLTNANASLDADIKYYNSVKDIPSPALFVYTLPNIVIGEISIRHQFKGENGFFITEQFDADFIHQYATNLINNNILQACVCGWVELLQEEYKAVLFLVEKTPGNASVIFDTATINKIYGSENG